MAFLLYRIRSLGKRIHLLNAALPRIGLVERCKNERNPREG